MPRELQSSYDAYAKKLINRELFVPINAVSESVDVAREAGTKITKKAADLFDNSFADNLQKTGFLRELWGEGSIIEGLGVSGFELRVIPGQRPTT